MKNIYAIEFLRIILTLQVFQFHPLGDFGMSKVFDGNVSVNVFLVIGGFLLYRTFAKPASPTFGEFAKKQWLRLAPPVIFIAALGAILGIWKFRPGTILLLDSGLGLNLRNPADIYYVVLWYVCAYFWWGLLIYWLLKNFEIKKLLPFFAAAAYLCLFAKYESLPGPLNYTYRVFSALGLGVITAYGAQGLSFNEKTACKIFWTILECGALFYIIRAKRWEFYNYIVAMGAMLMISHNAGFLTSWLNRQKWIFSISKYVYGMLVAQGLIVRGFKKYVFTEPYPKSAYVWVTMATVILAILTYHLVERRFMKK
jgi:hypothetical protein